jgi:two-component system, OmpR family, phosphate regulon sensor histidine kinase PhoR
VNEEDRGAARASDHREGFRRESEFQATLLAIAGHDLRQPLQVISNTYSWLARHRARSSALRYIRRGELAVARLSEQLDHLLDAFALHEHAAAIELKPLALGPLLARVCSDNADLARRKSLRLILCPTSGVVMSDEMLLGGAVRNLVRNAIKYTASGGRIVIGCRRRGSAIRIEVHDSGIGIPEEHLPKVFEAFHRVDSTRQDGLGLGLFIVRRAADLLGHRVEVRSSVGVGTCFSIVADAPAVVGRPSARG